MCVVRRLLAVVISVVAAVGFSTQVLALDCHNISRNVSSAEQTFATSQTPFLAFPIGVDPQTSKTVFWNVMPMFKGNWYLLALTEGAPEPVGATIDIWWGFIPPGTVPGVPGSNGNYTNGRVNDLLGLAACPVARQDIHGIVSGACGFSGP
jgi:hypothetical protein